MRQFNKYKGTKGFVVAAHRGLRFRYMITPEAQRRAKILTFWSKHGLAATTEAFGTSRATLFRWQGRLRQTRGQLEGLNTKSTAPHRRRRRVIPEVVMGFILKERQYDPHLSKDKLAVLLKQDGVANLSASTVGRVLTDLKKQGRLPDPKKLSFFAKTGRLIERPTTKRQKLRSKGHRGGLVKADTIVRFTNGIKRYLLTGIDCESKFAFAYTYASHSSKAAADFMIKFKEVAPVSVTHVQTDNGSEFADHFDVVLERHHIVHFHTYPRSPKMNAEIERFNRTLVEAFVSRHRSSLAYDLPAFNRALIDWLLWYNTRRPHWTLGLISPLRYIVSKLPATESQRWWTSTTCCHYMICILNE